MKKRNIFILFFILLMIYSFNLVENKNLSNLYGEKKQVQGVAYIYWYPNENLDNVSFYKLETGDNVYCLESKGMFSFCAWKFSFFREPISGWIKREKLR